MPAAVPLAEFEAPVAEAVVAVLTRSGVPAVLGARTPSGEEVEVLVPADRREEALAAMSAAMEDIRDEAQRRQAAAGAASPDDDEGDGDGRDGDERSSPLLFERLRSLAWLPVLLIPLLVVTLAQVDLPPAYMVAIVVVGMALLYAWRDGRRRREED